MPRLSPAGIRPDSGWLAGKDWTYIPTSQRVVALTFDAVVTADANCGHLAGHPGRATG